MSDDAAAEQFAQDVREVLIQQFGARPDVIEKRTFGMPAFYCARNGKMFAGATKRGLVLKLPAATVRELKTRPDAHDFGPGGRVMKEWVELRRDDAAGFADEFALILAAKDFVEQGSSPE